MPTLRATGQYAGGEALATPRTTGAGVDGDAVGRGARRMSAACGGDGVGAGHVRRIRVAELRHDISLAAHGHEAGARRTIRVGRDRVINETGISHTEDGCDPGIGIRKTPKSAVRHNHVHVSGARSRRVNTVRR